MRKTTVRVSDELFVLADKLAAATGRSLSEELSGLAEAGVRAKLAQVMAMSRQSVYILLVAADLPEPVSVEDLAESTQLTTNVIGGTLGLFERSGLVGLTKVSTESGWRTAATLTGQGRELATLAMLTRQRENGVA